MEKTASLDTDGKGKGKACSSGFFSDTLKKDFTLCSLCDLIVQNALSPNPRNSVLDCGFYTYYVGVMQDFNDTYRELDAFIPFLESVLRDMKSIMIYKTPKDAPAIPIMDPITFGFRQRTIKDHVRNSFRDLISDVRKIRNALDWCFSLSQRIVEICDGGGTPDAFISDSAMNRSKGLLEEIRKTTCTMREDLLVCKRNIQAFQELHEKVADQYFLN